MIGLTTVETDSLDVAEEVSMFSNDPGHSGSAACPLLIAGPFLRGSGGGGGANGASLPSPSKGLENWMSGADGGDVLSGKECRGPR